MISKLDAAMAVLRANGIPTEEPEPDFPDMPDIGEISGDETVYATSLASVFREDDDGLPEVEKVVRYEDRRLLEWDERLRGHIAGAERADGPRFGRKPPSPPPEAPEPHCAWYCPIHFFGHGWGIYIREACILQRALDLVAWIDWSAVAPLGLSIIQLRQRLLRASFYQFFLHEQFHHKVESLGFRLLVASGIDRYRTYKRNVYRPTFLTADCIEESLANADSYLRLSEDRYVDRLESPFRLGLRAFLRASFAVQPPGYREAIHCLEGGRFRAGTRNLQSRMLDGTVRPTTPDSHWLAAPDVIRSMMDITEEIFVILPRGARPLFPVTSIDPGHTVSTSELVRALTKHHGYAVEQGGGKGSHIKLTKPGGDPIVLKGNQRTLTPGLVRQALRTLGSMPLSRLPDVLEGRAP